MSTTIATRSYDAKRSALIAQVRARAGNPVRLLKNTSNLFRDRERSTARIDVRAFNAVLSVDSAAQCFEVEGMTSYQALADATFAEGLLPAVVPQLKSITIGGAISGLGIESSSFKYGLAHETVEEMEVLLPTGDMVVCTPQNEHSDLFYGMPNSYGTLGYVLRLRARAVRAKPYVELTHVRHRDPAAYFADLASWRGRDIDFLDGTVFAPDELYLTIGRFRDSAPFVSDYTFENIYYRSIRSKTSDYLKTLDYIWRWDTDWFWCSQVFGVQNPIVRRLVGRKRLNSVTYMRWLRFSSRFGLTRLVDRLRGLHGEAVIQDVDVPVERAPEFLEFFHREVGILPVWICPVRRHDPRATFPLFRMQPDVTYVNFGFWDSVRTRAAHPPGHFNRLVEQKVSELGGIKSLYSDSYYDPETFWMIYNKPAYDRLKAKYDPKGMLKNLYEKCVLRA